MEILQPENAPEINVHPIENENGEFESHIFVEHEGVMLEDRLDALHQAFTEIADQLQFEYRGCGFHLNDPARDAKEFFLKQTVFENRDPAGSPLPWKFVFHGPTSDPGAAIEALVGTFAASGEVDAQRVVGGIQEMEGAGGEDFFMIDFGYQGTIDEPTLQTIHDRLEKAAENFDLEYYGIEIEDEEAAAARASAISNGADDEPQNELSINEGIEWTDKVLDLTSKFDIADLAAAAPKIRDFHLKQLNSIGMQAADWMPTADKRLQN